jgi:acyl dehydratase
MSVVSHTPGGAFVATHGPVTSELLVRLATLLNDFNPAHYDLEFATAVGLPGVIGPGTLLQAWILRDVEAELADRRRVDGEPVIAELDLRFKEPFLVGDTIDISYTVDRDAIDIDVVARRGAGDTKRVATARARLVPIASPEAS